MSSWNETCSQSPANHEVTVRRIIGLDLSLTGTGVAQLAPDGTIELATIKTPPHATMEGRLVDAAARVLACVEAGDTVVVEGPAMHAKGAAVVQIFGLNVLVRCSLHRRGNTFFVVSPNTLKLFAAGTGHAKKSEMMREVWKRWSINAADDNQADAAALAYLGACITGQMTPSNDAQRRAVASVLTPKVKAKKGRAA